MSGKTSDLIRAAASRLRGLVSDRRRALRRQARVEVSLPFTVTPLGAAEGLRKGRPGEPGVAGRTRDLSETGLTLLLPSVRVGGAYLTDMESYLGINLGLPGGPVSMLAASVRFEQLSQREAGLGYLLAVRIIKMDNEERDRYLAYLAAAGRKERRGRSQAQAAIAEPSGQAQSGAWDAVTPASVIQAYEQFLRK
jgi:hypothetical protein